MCVMRPDLAVLAEECDGLGEKLADGGVVVPDPVRRQRSNREAVV